MQGPSSFANVIANTVVVAGPNGSILYYASNIVVGSDLPQAGNLAASVSNVTFTDPYGNAVLQGFTNYTVGLTGANAEQFWAGQINYYTGPNTEAGPWTFFDGIGQGGPGIELGKATQGIHIRDPVFPDVVAIDPATTSTPETWHTMSGFLNGWTASSRTPRYRIKIDNEVELDGAVNGAAATAVNIIVLSANYRPASQMVRGTQCNAGVIAGQGPGIVIQTGGTIAAVGVTPGTAGMTLDLSCRFPLN